MSKVRAAIIGCGKVAHVHAKALQEIEECIFVAAQSRNPARANEFAAQYGVKPYATVEEMVTKEKVDVVVVCTPHPEHKNPAVAALNAGAHVLVEKPLAVTLADCDAMIEAAAKNKKNLGMISQRRFSPAAVRMKKAIDDGKLGRPAIGTVVMFGWRSEEYYKSDPWRGSWEKEGGGILVNQAPHQLDLIQWFMDDEIEELFGVYKNVNHPYIEVEDTAVAILKFKKGGIANIVVSNSQNPGLYAKVHVFGTNGAVVGVQTDGGSMFVAGMPSVVEPPVNDTWTIPGEEALLAKWNKEDVAFFKTIDPIGYYMRLQNRDFILSVIENRPPLVTGEEGRKTVEIFSAIYKSSEDNKPVRWPL
ncbi:MAG: Gfo/Idh/MocA family oxidoreductase [Chitinophagaceae bacterium]